MFLQMVLPFRRRECIIPPSMDNKRIQRIQQRGNAMPTIRQRRKMQHDFLGALGPMGHLLKTVLDICPDVFAWFADMDDRLMFVNRLNVQMCNFHTEFDAVGKTCADLFPAHMASIYMERCRQVRTTGQPIIETIYDHASDYSTELRLMNVLPLKTPNGKIVGTVTIYRRAASDESIPDWYGKVKKSVAYIDAHYAENIAIADIAREAGFSESQFRRVFERVIAKSPIDYITTIRLNVQMCNLHDELDVLGMTCAELWPEHMATIYMERCRQVRTTGQPIIETLYDHASDYSTELRITNVFPLKTPNGKIVGTVTIYRRAASDESIPDWYGKVKKAVAYIDAHFAENISVVDIARESGFSESQFRRVFERVIAKSPVDYITTIRLNAARKLLTTTEKSVADIAVEVGFFDQSHFIKAFKRERGTTPGRYRRQFWKE